MSHPKVKAVSAVDDHTLIVEFDNSEKKKYDVRPLLEKKMFHPLKNPELFKSVQVELGGYAVAWSSDIDISEHELWCHGQTVP